MAGIDIKLHQPYLHALFPVGRIIFQFFFCGNWNWLACRDSWFRWMDRNALCNHLPCFGLRLSRNCRCGWRRGYLRNCWNGWARGVLRCALAFSPSSVLPLARRNLHVKFCPHPHRPESSAAPCTPYSQFRICSAACARITAFHAEENELPRQRPVLHFTIRSLDLDVDAEVRNVASVFRMQIAAVDNVLLRDSNQHIFERNELGCVILLDLFQMVAEASFSCAPVRHRVAVRFVRRLEFCFVPVFFRARGCPSGRAPRNTFRPFEG